MKPLRSMLEQLFHRSRPVAVVPVNPEHAALLDHADRFLEEPRIQRILSTREREMKAAFARTSPRLRR